MYTAVWLKRARLPEVTLALTYEQHGFFEQAQLAYEQVGHTTIQLNALETYRFTCKPVY